MLQTDKDDDSTVCSTDRNGKTIITTGDLLQASKDEFSLGTNLKRNGSKRAEKKVLHI